MSMARHNNVAGCSVRQVIFEDQGSLSIIVDDDSYQSSSEELLEFAQSLTRDMPHFNLEMVATYTESRYERGKPIWVISRGDWVDRGGRDED